MLLAQQGDVDAVQRDGAGTPVGLGSGLVRIPAVDHDLAGGRDEAGVQVDVGPALTDCLAPAETAGADEVKEPVEAIGFVGVQERAELCRAVRSRAVSPAGVRSWDAPSAVVTGYLPDPRKEIYVGRSRHWAVVWLWFLS
ncbi:hypothetical protein GCM10011583_65050 [Streptomyces camponoticapitis]|uniref:Uncharacterized protein n=1 Tax=Streptomyces camponoticapitis TaxID=1616125 RepID=A0ABQ2ESU2_9ACTN|nr:hypothetical protein GCM10011583_65050 [Streptomyces camponoticapitis]